VTAAFQVDRWLVEPSLNSISRNGATTRLEPKVMQVLVCLAEHAGETQSKEDLMQIVWPDTFVSDDALTHCISELRRVFEDDARQPRVIQTIARRGYRLIAPINSTTVAVPVPYTAIRDSIAVLPFINMSSDPENEFFADGITEEIINALAQIKDLHVVARSSAFSFKGKHIDPRVIGEQLSVRTVLEGSVRKAGDTLRITVQLVNASDGFHLWSERYDREMKDVFAVQEEIARSIAERLRIALEIRVEGPLVKTGTRNLQAYQLYAKGRALLYRRGPMSPLALECLEHAVALDPEYALAWAGIAEAHSLLTLYGFEHPEMSKPKWREAAHRAIAADAFLAEAHNALAIGSLWYDCNKIEAEQEFLRALELNPRYIQALDWFAIFFLQLAANRLAEGVAHAKLAVEYDPLSGYTHAQLAHAYATAGKHDEAVQSAQRAVELVPDSISGRVALQTAYYFSGRLQEGVAAGRVTLALCGRHPFAMGSLALTLAESGKTTEAEFVYEEMIARARWEYVSPSVLAWAAAAAARWDEAIGLVCEAVRIGDPARCVLSSRWLYGRLLRSDSRIDQMLREHGID
jgi:TolB-like protein